MGKFIVPIRGMHCRSCEILIEDNLKEVKGVKSVNVSYKDGKAKVHFEGPTPSKQSIREAVQAAGYEIGQKEKLPWISRNPQDYFYLLLAGSILAILYFVAKSTGLFNVNISTGGGSMGVVVLVGLVAGFSSCMALIGGLVLGLAARHSELHPEATAMQKFRPHLFFNVGRIAGYAFFGGVIGLLGSAFRPSASTLGIMTIIVGGVMIFLGLKLIEIFPALRDKTITLPKFISRALGIRNENKEYSHKSALLGGAMTFFLPCGFTQAMQLYAVSTGSFTKGAMIMMLFALGTAPGLLGIGGLSSVFKGQKARIFFMGAGIAVIMLGIFNISNASRLVFTPGTKTAKTAQATGPAQEVRMTQSDNGYSPKSFTVVKGRPVKWIINSTSPYSCSSYIVMSAYKISQPLKSGENIIEFTPTKTGTVGFTCSMGMYRGSFNVIEDTNPVQSQAAPTSTPQQAQPVAEAKAAEPATGTQVLKTVYRTNNDIEPNTFTVKAGQAARLEVDVKDEGYGCMSTIMIPGLYNQPELLEKNKTLALDFTAKDKGEYPITCAMGVQRGIINVE
jgi:sulfite exporter TauE/SafE/copper chaperone CopZ